MLGRRVNKKETDQWSVIIWGWTEGGNDAMIIQCYYWSICEKTPDGQVIPISEPGTTIRNIVIRETRWGDGDVMVEMMMMVMMIGQSAMMMMMMVMMLAIVAQQFRSCKKPSWLSKSKCIENPWHWKLSTPDPGIMKLACKQIPDISGRKSMHWKGLEDKDT